MRDWDDVEGWLTGIAERDMGDTGGVRPTLVAFAAQRPLLLVRCRPFGTGEGPGALREVLDIAVPLGADRVAISFGGRARALGDGTPPEPRDGAPPRDIVLIAVAQRGAGRVDLRCTLRQVTPGGRTAAIPPAAGAAPVAGWLPRMLVDALSDPPAARPPPEIITARVRRSITVGHEVHRPVEQDATT